MAYLGFEPWFGNPGSGFANPGLGGRGYSPAPTLNPDGSYRRMPLGGPLMAGDASPGVMGGSPLTQNYWNYGGPQHQYGSQDLVPFSQYNYGTGTTLSGNVPSYDAWIKQTGQNPNFMPGEGEQTPQDAYSQAMAMGLMNPQQFQANIDRNRPQSGGLLGAAASGIIGAAGLPGGTSAVDKGLGSPEPAPQYNMPGGNNMPYYPGGTPGFQEGSGGGLFDNLLGNLGNLSPAILAGYLGNSQRQDVMGQVGKLNDLAGSLSGPAFMNSITNPYDLQTGMGRNALTQNLQQRGVGGSSFGNQQLGNYDYQRGLGRGDLATRAQAGIAGTQGQLYSDALRGIVGGNAAYNSLFGAGLGAAGSLFNKGSGSTGNGLFDWLRNLGGNTGGIPGSLPTDPNGGGQVDFGNDPSLTQFDPNIDWSSLYG